MSSLFSAAPTPFWSSALASAALQASTSSLVSFSPLCDSCIVRPPYEQGPPVFSQMKSAMFVRSGATFAAGSALKAGPIRGSASAFVQNASTTPAMPSRPPSRRYSDGVDGAVVCEPIEAHAASPSETTSSIRLPHTPVRFICSPWGPRYGPGTCALRSAQPAFTALVVLDVPVRLAGADLGQAQIELLDVGVVAQGGGRPFQDDAPVLHDVAVLGDGQGQGGVLLDEE